MAISGATRGAVAVHWRILVEVIRDIWKDTFLAFDSISFMISVGVGIVLYLVLIRR